MLILVLSGQSGFSDSGAKHTTSEGGARRGQGLGTAGMSHAQNVSTLWWLWVSEVSRREGTRERSVPTLGDKIIGSFVRLHSPVWSRETLHYCDGWIWIWQRNLLIHSLANCRDIPRVQKTHVTNVTNTRPGSVKIAIISSYVTSYLQLFTYRKSL